MFLKRFIKSENSMGGPRIEPKVINSGPPPGMQTMGASLQSKFAKGVNYNMKIIVKGDRNVGKTCLHLRLQGKKFREEYLPTDEIQVASIQWNYRNSEDIIKVEIWDIVDKGRKKKMEGLKFNMAMPQLSEETCLDAEFVDVFKGTHGVIMVFDITKQWTFDYVEKELTKVPSATPVLILANHRDMGHHRTVSEETIRTLVEEAQQSREGPIKFAEASMRNGYGLKYIHKFFSLPFLHLQKMTLLVQLEKNTEDTEATMQELDFLESTEDQNYEVFSDNINSKRRELQDKLAEQAIEDARQPQQQMLSNQISKSNGKGGLNNGVSLSKSFSFSTSLLPIKESSPAPLIPTNLNIPISSKKPTHPPSLQPSAIDTSVPSASAPSTPCQSSTVVGVTGGFLGKFLTSARKNKKQECLESATRSTVSATNIGEPPASVSSLTPVRNVDEFQPEVDDDIEHGFLDDVPEEVKPTNAPLSNKTLNTKMLSSFAKETRNNSVHQDSDEETSTFGNPLVAGFQDNLDSSDEETFVSSSWKADATNNMSISSDDDDDDFHNTQVKTNGLEIHRSEGVKQRAKNINTMSAFALVARNEECGDSDADDDVNVIMELNGKAESPKEAPPTFHTFNAADFDALEEKYMKQDLKNTSIVVDNLSTSTDDDLTKMRKKKHKTKDTQSSEEGKKNKSKKSSKQHKEKIDESEERKKKKKNKKQKEQDIDLEKFLESSTAYESL